MRFVPENPAQQPCEFDFSDWPISLPLRRAFIAAFAERTRPGGRVRTVESAYKTWRTLRLFAVHLATLVSPPERPEQLTPAQLTGWYLPRQQHVGISIQFGELKTTLRKVEGVTAEFLAALNERSPGHRTKTRAKRSYSRTENQRILNAARADLRRAADRIRGNRDLLRRWRAGDVDEQPGQSGRIGELLDYVDRHHNVPRQPAYPAQPQYWVAALGTVEQHRTALHLSANEAAAFVVLLVGLTGQNRSTILGAPATHHRPDGHTTEGIASAIVELDKPRRGSRRHMDVPLTSLPQWAQPGGGASRPDGSPPDGESRVDLHSPFGVYMLAHELTAPARQALGNDRLLAWAGIGGGQGLRTQMQTTAIQTWSRGHDLPTDAALTTPGGPEQLTVTLGRLRLTYNELQQRPVAHTDTTLANEYLARNRGNLTEYQRVVADALAEQVTKATTRGRVRTLSEQDIAEAREHPDRVAARHGMDANTLQRMLSGEMDTVLGACVDHTNSPHTTAGQPCRASFMLCLSCPCARATPDHLPVQVLVHDELDRRKTAVTPLRWAQRFALPHAQLADLLTRAGQTAVVDARQAATVDQRQLVDRFLNRELDQP